MDYRLHYAPDNASLVVRLCLDQLGLPFETVLVDRAARAQESAPFRTLNPNGLIPVLETPDGVMFETGAICLWLADRHGGLGPGHDAPARGDFLKWLFFVANTLHPSLRMMFYPGKYIQSAQETLRAGLRLHLAQSFRTLETVAAARPDWLGGATPSLLDFYICACMRWSAIYPATSDHSWFTTLSIPHLRRMAQRIEALPCTHILQTAEGLGPTPFSNPILPTPPEGSAT
jgi:glutathione S-transferase